MRPTVFTRLALLGPVACAACASIPNGQTAIDTVTVHGARSVDPGDVAASLATTESPRFLGMFEGVVYDYSLYDESVLQRDLARVERYYRGRGFLEAHARAARVTHLAKDHVRVDIQVEEGPPTLNRRLQIDGIGGLPLADAVAVRAAARAALPADDRFDEETYKKGQDAIVRALQDHGYAYAKLKTEAQADRPASAPPSARSPSRASTPTAPDRRRPSSTRSRSAARSTSRRESTTRRSRSSRRRRRSSTSRSSARSPSSRSSATRRRP
jgi:outer membrane protein assembly factor BamA